MSALASLWRGLWRVDYSAGIYRLLRFNLCVTAHELRMRMRGFRLFWVMFFYAGVAAAAFLIAMWAAAWQEHAGQGNPGMLQPGLGRTVLGVISYVQLSLVLLILPAYSAGAITMEREKRTLEMLRVTLLSPSDVVTGKWLVVLGLGGVLLLSSLPVAAWCLALGGVAPEELAYIYSYLFLTAAFASALGMLFSTLVGRSIAAIVWTYAALIALYVGPLVGLAVSAAGRMSTNPMTLAFGRTWAWIILFTLLPECAWLLFLALRWPAQRLLSRQWRWIGWTFAAAAAAGFCGWCVLPRGTVVTLFSHLPAGMLFLSDPYMTLAGLLFGSDIASQLVAGAATLHTAVPLQTLVWMVASAWTFVITASLWAVAVRTYRVRE